jgi:hypothetical protein
MLTHRPKESNPGNLSLLPWCPLPGTPSSLRLTQGLGVSSDCGAGQISHPALKSHP